MGLLISFSGIDGAGKSTQVKFLADYLRKKGKKVYVTEEMFGYYLLRPLVKILRAATGSPSGGPVKRNRTSLAKFWFIPAFIDIRLGYVFKISPMLNKHDFVLADRFYTDIWANLAYYGYLPNWAFNVFVKLLPKSNINIILSVNHGVAQKRTGEFNFKYYKEQRDIYIKLASYINSYIIETKKNPSEVFMEVLKLLKK